MCVYGRPMGGPAPRRGARLVRFACATVCLAPLAEAQQLSELLEAGSCSIRMAAGEDILGAQATAGSCWLEGERQPITDEASCVATGVCSDAATLNEPDCVGLGTCSDDRASTEADCESPEPPERPIHFCVVCNRRNSLRACCAPLRPAPLRGPVAHRC